MAVGNNSSATFYSISDGKICRQFKEMTLESISRTNKLGRIVHEEFYDYIDGIITEISVRENDYGKQWNIFLLDNGTIQLLNMPYSSGYASAFLKMLPNVDLQQRIKIIPKMVMEGDKKKTGLFLTQNGVPVKWFYTKEHPQGLPQMVQKKVKGQMVWDDSDMMEFLEKMVTETIVPNLKTPVSVIDHLTSEVEKEIISEKPDGKLPF